MNKKIIALLFLLILLVSVTITYAFVTQSTNENKHQTDTGSTIDENTLTNEIDTTFLDENAGVDIGEML